jgi:hypothetical protein
MLENKIILRSIYKFTKVFMEPAINPATGRYADVVRRVDSNGDMILNEEDRRTGRFLIPESDVIELYDGIEFNLDNEIEAARWESIRFSKKIAQDRWERDSTGNLIVDGNAKRYGTAELYVERAGVESRIRNDRRRKIHEAKEYVYNDKEGNLYQMVRLLGYPMTGLPPSDVEDYLITIAERTPEKILELYTGTDTHLRLLLVDALDRYVIYNRDKLYYYGDNIPLGGTENAVITYFKTPSNKRIVDMIKAEVYPGLYKFDRASEIDKLTNEDLEAAETVSAKDDVQDTAPKASSRTRGAK